jgi:hypothetical protein
VGGILTRLVAVSGSTLLLCGRSESISCSQILKGRWCVCVKLWKTTKRLELGVLDALVGDLQQELRFLVYDGSEGFGESLESRCCTRPRDKTKV